PWIFKHAAELLAVGATPASPSSITAKGETGLIPTIAPPTIHEQRDALAEHFAIAMEIHGEQLAGRRMRKMGIKYSRFHPRAADVKRDFINVRSLRDWQGVLDRYYAADGPGVWPAPDAADEVNESDSAATDSSCEAAA